MQNNLKNITPADLINTLPHFEYSEREKRVPKFFKWRMMKIKGFEVYDRKLMRIVPDEEYHGFSAEQLNKLIPIDEMIDKVPKDVQRNGGWLIFDGVYMKKFITNQEFSNEYREIPNLLEEMVAPVRKYQITKISKKKNSDDWIVKTGETQWYWIGVIFSVLKPRVGDWLTIGTNKQYGVIRNPDAEDYTPPRHWENNQKETDVEVDVHEKPQKQEYSNAPIYRNREEQIAAEQQAQRDHALAALAAEKEEAVEVLAAPPAEIEVECAEECGGCHPIEDDVDEPVIHLTEEERVAAIDFLKNDLKQSA